jgi:PAS domain S-box-containing protein
MTSMGKTLRVLHVEDSEQDMALISRHLKKAGYDVISDRVEAAETMKAALESREWDVILCDYLMPQFNALAALALVKEMSLDIPFIIISGTIGEEAAVEAMRGGAQDYLMKDALARLVPSIERELEEAKNRRAGRAAEEALLTSERKYRLLFDSNPLPIWVFDRETLRFLAVNKAAIAHYGFSREEFLAMTIEDIRPPEELPKLKQVLSQPVAELKRTGIWRHRKKDGTMLDVEITSHPLDFGDRAAMLTLANDVSEKIRAQDQLAAMTQQLWHASKLTTMGELSASIAHELNNPLATIALRVENLLMPMAADHQQRHGLEIIAQEVDRMARLVENLLQFSRRSHRQESTVDVREEISNSVEFIHYHLRTRKIEVVREFADSLPTIQADRQQLRQLFLNLLTNAGDAMPEGGKLIVRADPIRLEGAEAVAIEFADTGEGITAENLERIWEPFFTTKPEGKGTGLGLAICRRIVEEPGGTIDIQSQAGGGTSVRMVFPATSNGLLANLQ